MCLTKLCCRHVFPGGIKQAAVQRTTGLFLGKHINKQTNLRESLVRSEPGPWKTC